MNTKVGRRHGLLCATAILSWCLLSGESSGQISKRIALQVFQDKYLSAEMGTVKVLSTFFPHKLSPQTVFILEDQSEDMPDDTGPR